ncbi:TPM domain-containing protein [Gammaproteobacteria bacterium]|nr:TPM domain-containing protein [Gammaproteobacteria bacterium]
MIRSSLLLLIWLTGFGAFAEEKLDIPRASGSVNDFANIIEPSWERRIAQGIKRFESDTGHEIAVLTVKELPGRSSIEIFAIEVARAWGVGKAQRDNAVLLLVAQNNRQMRIEVGYGLEGSLTDASADAIIRRVLIPAFREDAYSQGIDDGVKAIIDVIRGEPPPTRNSKYRTSSSEAVAFIFVAFLMFLLMIFPFILSYASNQRNLRWAMAEDKKNNPELFEERLSSNYYQRTYLGFGEYDDPSRHGGQGGGGGFGGGGFGGGGFGGGGFGGGGASGGW